jgi:hypothetical protein
MFGMTMPHPLNFLLTRESIPFGLLHDSCTGDTYTPLFAASHGASPYYVSLTLEKDPLKFDNLLFQFLLSHS